MAELIGQQPECDNDLDAIVPLIRQNVGGRVGRRDVERALMTAQTAFDGDQMRDACIWATLALGLLEVIRLNSTGIRGRIELTLLEGSGQARNLEAYAHMARGAASLELDRFETARQELERAKEAYSRNEAAEQEAVRVSVRLGRLELRTGNWQKAELIAESALHQMRDWGSADDKGECLRVLGLAQLRMGRLEAAAESAAQILAASNIRTALRAQAYLLKATVELETGYLGDASADCQKAQHLFDEARDRRGIQDSRELELQIAKIRRQASE